MRNLYIFIDIRFRKYAKKYTGYAANLYIICFGVNNIDD